MKLNNEYRLHAIAGERVALRQGRSGADLTRIVSMNGTSVALYEAFCGRDSFSEEEVRDALVSSFGISEERAAEDARKWIESLKACNMIVEE